MLLSIPNRYLKVLGLLFVFCTACATTRRYEAVLQNWVGHDASELTRKWGPPTSLQQLADGNKIYEYDRRDLDGPRPSRSTASAPVSCQTQFFVNPTGTVVGWTHSGYDCRAK